MVACSLKVGNKEPLRRISSSRVILRGRLKAQKCKRKSKSALYSSVDRESKLLARRTNPLHRSHCRHARSSREKTRNLAGKKKKQEMYLKTNDNERPAKPMAGPPRSPRFSHRWENQAALLISRSMLPIPIYWRDIESRDETGDEQRERRERDEFSTILRMRDTMRTRRKRKKGQTARSTKRKRCIKRREMETKEDASGNETRISEGREANDQEGRRLFHLTK